ncbi:MAG: response regulator transcription factor [Patescibacteria group bacterium]|nr:response regulator transcription factor [Patescibacteria group bacterium]MCL5431635.1 response regulator transcription factor [Patescibacteria group bacterium]
MKVLVVEDEHQIANSIKRGLEQEGMVVDVAYDGTQGYDLAAAEEHDVIVLDILLPGLDGREICRRLRAEKNHTPILMLTAKGQLEDKVAGLNSGADDYLIKPFAFEELLARIRALGRRPASAFGQELKTGDLTLNPVTFEVKLNDKPITFSRKEFSLLEYLMRHPGKLLSKDQIIAHVWDYEADILPNTVEVYIGYLRKKLPNLIHTARGFGYKLG